MEEVIKHFSIDGNIIDIIPLSQGLINRSYHIVSDKGEYLLQKINTKIFHDIDGMMGNIEAVTSYLKDKGVLTLEIVPTLDNHLHYDDYRIYRYIPNSFAYDKASSTDQFYLTGLSFGSFHDHLRDFSYPLVETIPHFHDTPRRLEAFKQAVSLDQYDRVKEVQETINALLLCQDIAYSIIDKTPLTIAHNDTKLGNILFDKTTKKPLCIIDLDTLMPGYLAYDYGDALRSGANHATEDETDLSQVYFDMEMFNAFTRGFLEGIRTYDENILESLENGIYVMIYEQALRFMTDYLEGDHYYAIDYPTHNLSRARNQLCLLQSALENKDFIHKNIRNYAQSLF